LKSLRIGCVKYLNARPLIRGWPGDVDFDHPSALCNKLAKGELDIALASSFEFLRNPVYRVVDGVSISSAGPVYSVGVAHSGDISEIREIELDPASETSAKLLQCLLAELNFAPLLSRTSTSVITAHRARLFIGDQAIRFHQRHAGEFRFWDLGEQWNKLVGLPFVYALWLIRPEVRDSKPLAERLRKLRDENLADIDRLVAEEKEFDHDFCRRYYRENLRFSFGDDEKAGLAEFNRRCWEQGLLPLEQLEAGSRDVDLPLRCV
jgi:predicted solute-binding protein